MLIASPSGKGPGQFQDVRSTMMTRARLPGPLHDLAERPDEVFGSDRGTFARLETGLRDHVT